MSVAKTRDQKEAQLANIRIIKARFASDGQTFTNCTFNNDTMEIRIYDERYKNKKINNGRKHYDSDDINKMENEINKIHVVASQLIDGEIVGLVKNDGVNDALKNDMLKKFNELKQVDETNSIIIKDDITDGVNEGISEGVTEGTNMEDWLPNNKIESVDEISEDDFVDPDEVYTEHKNIREMLLQGRKNQIVIKKE